MLMTIEGVFQHIVAVAWAEKLGTVDSVTETGPACIGYDVVIGFQQQPDNLGQMILVGQDSGKQLDFSAITQGGVLFTQFLPNGSYGFHDWDEPQENYIYWAFGNGFTCDPSGVDPMIVGEAVAALLETP